MTSAATQQLSVQSVVVSGVAIGSDRQPVFSVLVQPVVGDAYSVSRTLKAFEDVRKQLESFKLDALPKPTGGSAVYLSESKISLSKWLNVALTKCARSPAMLSFLSASSLPPSVLPSS